MKYNDFEAHVCAEDHALDEYQVANEGANTVTCWIASEEGKEFTIKGDNTSISTSLDFQIEVDGRLMDALVVEPQTSSMSRGAPVSSTSVRPFTFFRLDVTDDDAFLLQDSKKLEMIGTIRVLIRRVIIKDTGPYEDFKVDTGETGLVHERSKKAGLHCVSLGKEKQTAPSSTADVDFLDTLENPYCTFVFRYRSKDILKAQGITALPASASPQRVSPAPRGLTNGVQPNRPAEQRKTSDPKKRPREGSASKTLDTKGESGDEGGDTEALQTQLDAIQAKLAKARAKKNHKRVKREPTPIQLDTSEDIIDLTSD